MRDHPLRVDLFRCDSCFTVYAFSRKQIEKHVSSEEMGCGQVINESGNPIPCPGVMEPISVREERFDPRWKR